MLYKIKIPKEISIQLSVFNKFWLWNWKPLSLIRHEISDVFNSIAFQYVNSRFKQNSFEHFAIVGTQHWTFWFRWCRPPRLITHFELSDIVNVYSNYEIAIVYNNWEVVIVYNNWEVVAVSNNSEVANFIWGLWVPCFRCRPSRGDICSRSLRRRPDSFDTWKAARSCACSCARTSETGWKQKFYGCQFNSLKIPY